MDQHKEGKSITDQVIEMLDTDSGDFYIEMFKLVFLALALGIASDIDHAALRAAAEKRQAAGFAQQKNNCPYVMGNTPTEEMKTNVRNSRQPGHAQSGRKSAG